MAGRRTGRPPVSRPEWSDVRDVLHLRLKDAAAALNASTIYLRHLCHQNGFPRGWPGKKVWPGAREIDRSTTTSNSCSVSDRATLLIHGAADLTKT